MAILSSQKSAPMRSISLPARLNSDSLKTESELTKLKTWEMSVNSSNVVSVDVLKIGLVGLEELYNCLENLVNSLLTQQALIQYQNGKLIEETLESSIGLLDSTTMTKDLSLMLKDNVRNLQSMFRRKGDTMCIDSGINAYMRCKKKLKIETSKCLKALKKMENSIGSTPLLDVNIYLSMVIRVLREVAVITISVLRFVVLFLSGQVTKTKPSRWSLISNIMLKSSSKTNEKIIEEVQSFDFVMQSSVNVDEKITRIRLEALDQGLGGLEDLLNCLFRSMIKYRVSLLNILVQ